MDIPLEQSETQKESVDSTRKGLTSVAIPEVSTSHEEQTHKQGCPPDMPSKEEQKGNPKKEDCHWYVLRATYGREMKAKNYLDKCGVITFLPTRIKAKRIGKRITTFEVPLVNNIFFAKGTEEELKTFVYDNINLPFLRFYYQHYTGIDGNLAKKPQVVPDRQMESFKIIYKSTEADTIMSNEVVEKFSKGDLVQVTDGPFAGVEGHVARYQGQQRVGIIIGNLLTVTTAFVPNRYIKRLE